MKNLKKIFFSLLMTTVFFLHCGATTHVQAAAGWTDLGSTVALTNIADKVGVGTTNPLGKFQVVGNSFFTGNVGINTTNPATPLQIGSGPKLGFAPQGEMFSTRQDASTSVDHLNSAIISNFSGTTANSLQGLESYMTTNHSSGNLGRIINFVANTEILNKGTVGDILLHGGSVIMDDGSGAVTNVYAFQSGKTFRVGSGSGNITNFYGLYLDAQPLAGITNRYGIYQLGAGEYNYFAGKVGIGTNNPLFDLQVNGTASANKIAITASSPSNESVGTSTISAFAESTTINTTAIKETSLIFVTSKTNVNSPLAVTSQISGSSFTVSIGTPQSQNVDFNWWIVDKE